MRGIRGLKHSVKTASNNSKSEDLHDDPIYTVRKPNKIFDSFKKEEETKKKNGNPSTIPSNLNYLDIKFTALKSNIPGDSKAVSTDLYETFKSYIKIVAEVNNFENQIIN